MASTVISSSDSTSFSAYVSPLDTPPKAQSLRRVIAADALLVRAFCINHIMSVNQIKRNTDESTQQWWYSWPNPINFDLNLEGFRTFKRFYFLYRDTYHHLCVHSIKTLPCDWNIIAYIHIGRKSVFSNISSSSTLCCRAAVTSCEWLRLIYEWRCPFL